MRIQILILGFKGLIKVQQAIDTIIFFKNKLRTFEKQHCENGQNVALIRYHICYQFVRH